MALGSAWRWRGAGDEMMRRQLAAHCKIWLAFAGGTAYALPAYCVMFVFACGALPAPYSNGVTASDGGVNHRHDDNEMAISSNVNLSISSSHPDRDIQNVTANPAHDGIDGVSSVENRRR